MRRVIVEIILLSLFFLGLGWFFLPAAGEEPSLLMLTLAYLAIAAPQIGVTIYVISRTGRPLADFGMQRPAASTWARLGLAFLGAVVILAVCSLILYVVLGTEAGRTLRQRPFGWSLSPAEIPLLALFCLAVGYREEVFFRSYLITRLGDLGVKPIWAVIGSSVVFGAAHFYEGVFGIVTAALIGAFFGFVFVKTKDVHVVAGAHALYNLGVWLVGFLALNQALPGFR